MARYRKKRYGSKSKKNNFTPNPEIEKYKYDHSNIYEIKEQIYLREKLIDEYRDWKDRYKKTYALYKENNKPIRDQKLKEIDSKESSWERCPGIMGLIFRKKQRTNEAKELRDQAFKTERELLDKLKSTHKQRPYLPEKHHFADDPEDELFKNIYRETELAGCTSEGHKKVLTDSWQMLASERERIASLLASSEKQKEAKVDKFKQMTWEEGIILWMYERLEACVQGRIELQERKRAEEKK